MYIGLYRNVRETGAEATTEASETSQTRNAYVDRICTDFALLGLFSLFSFYRDWLLSALMKQ